MIRDYSDIYFEDYINLLADAVDTFVYLYHKDIDEFIPLLIKSGLAFQLERLNSKYIVEYSGVELSKRMLEKQFEDDDLIYFSDYDHEKSEEYWAGWILAHLQYRSKIPFRILNRYIKLSEIKDLYYPYHEANEDKAVQLVMDIYHKKNKISNLQYMRKLIGISQSELARKANINLRTLQQYESRAKDINNASVSTVLAISKALHCPIEDLLEY